MPRGIDGKCTNYGMVIVSLDAAGNGTATVTFWDAFVAIPAVLVVPKAGDAGTYASADVTKTGMRITITGSGVKSQDLRVTYFAHEKT